MKLILLILSFLSISMFCINEIKQFSKKYPLLSDNKKLDRVLKGTRK